MVLKKCLIVNVMKKNVYFRYMYVFIIFDKFLLILFVILFEVIINVFNL